MTSILLLLKYVKEGSLTVPNFVMNPVFILRLIFVISILYLALNKRLLCMLSMILQIIQ
jgi:hypothetical protein